MDYGKGIRTVRAARGLSQKALAAAAAVDPSFLSLLERGERSPSMSTLEAIAAGLGVPVYLLMLFSSEKEDLRGVSPDQAGLLGTQILDLLTETGSGSGA